MCVNIVDGSTLFIRIIEYLTKSLIHINVARECEMGPFIWMASSLILLDESQGFAALVHHY